MNNAEFERPTPKALDDAALELALAEAKESPDGLLAAMILLEQQEQLRRADELALAAWLESRSQNVEPVTEEPITVDAPAENSLDEVLTSQDDAADEQTDIDLEEDFPYEPISASEVTVTTTLNQIVADVNEAFSPIAAAEEATALEEAEQVANHSADVGAPAPHSEVSLSTAPSTPKRQRAKLLIDWKSFALPVLTGGVFAASGFGFATVALGLVVGAVVSWSLALIAAKAERRSSTTHQIMARATFGVWGASLPTLTQFLARLLLLASLAIWAVESQLASRFVNYSQSVASAPLGSEAMAVAALVLLVLVLALFMRTSRIVTAVLASASLLLATLVGLLNLGTMQPSSPDLVGTITVAVAYFVFDAFVLGPSLRFNRETPGSNAVVRLAIGQLLPAVVSSLVISTVLSMASDQPLSTSLAQNALYTFVVDLGFVPLLVAAFAVVIELARRIVDDVAALRFTKVWGLTLAAVISVVATLLVEQPLKDLAFASVNLLSAICVGASVPYLTETLMRTGNFHEVSLQRGYAFYRRFGVASLLGFVALLIFGYATSTYGPIGSGSIGFTLDPIFGDATAVVYMITFAIAWTLATSWIRIRHQQNEVSALERRRNEIAGFDVFE